MKIKLTVFAFILASTIGIGESKEAGRGNISAVNSSVLIKHTFSAGGGKMSGNNYVVISSIGQIDAGHVTSGGGKQFIGGILAAPRNNELFKDGFE